MVFPFKIAISGKGGVGKTTIAAGLARHYARAGRRVIAIDADPDANLASALGMRSQEAAEITPIAAMGELVAERTGAQPGTIGGIFKLNPKVDDIPDRFSREVAGVRLLVMGTVERGGSGCVCPESALLRALMRHLVLERQDVVIMDMEAGIEHLGRATAQGVDLLLVVVEPGRRSLDTARAVARLANELGIPKVAVVANKVRSPTEEKLIVGAATLPLVAVIAESDAVREADLKGLSPYDASPCFANEIAMLAESIGREVSAATAAETKRIERPRQRPKERLSHG